ncbi:hypothetical protein K438DRAFT_1804435 [Mycena galopus ATCC 62051]|nr:hypothetical protein K438DRAFT_1804435 [Mycena galopus ATCC 62051]
MPPMSSGATIIDKNLNSLLPAETRERPDFLQQPERFVTVPAPSRKICYSLFLFFLLLWSLRSSPRPRFTRPRKPTALGAAPLVPPCVLQTWVLGNLALESAVTELLVSNRAALHRLGTLQVARLRGSTNPTSAVDLKEGDEDWDVAHGILDSLTLLASLRPRSSARPVLPLVPPPRVLHALQLTLPRAAVPG